MSKVDENYTKIENLYFDELMQLLSAPENLCYLQILRKTRGWGKEVDALSLSQLVKLTGLTKPTIVKACKSLVDKGIIGTDLKGHTNSYWLNPLTSKAILLVKEFYQGSKGILPKTSKGILHTKETTKETIQKKDTSQSEITETPQLCAPKVARASKIKQLIPCKEIADLYNEVLGDVLPQVQTLSESRKKLITKRWQQMLNSISAKGNVRYTDKASGLIWWRAVFGKVRMNDFWLGGSDGKWAASFDWIIKENNFIKILEWVPPVENRKKEQHG